MNQLSKINKYVEGLVASNKLDDAQSMVLSSINSSVGGVNTEECKNYVMESCGNTSNEGCVNYYKDACTNSKNSRCTNYLVPPSTNTKDPCQG